MKKYAFLVAVLLSAMSCAWGQVVADADSAANVVRLSSEEVSDLFSQGKRLFAEGIELQRDDPDAAYERYSKALLYFERIVSDGKIRNGKLYYNIGNVYFRLGDVGNAILYYLRAEEYIPNDLNLVRNLEYARSRRADNIEPSERSRILRILFFWHFDLSSRFRLLGFIVSFILVWIFAGIRLVKRVSAFSWTAIVFSVLAVLFAGSLTWETLDRNRNIPGVILEFETVGRKGNSETYQPSFQEPLHAGTEITLTEDRGDWYLVELADGRTTWLPADAAGLVRKPK